MSELKNKFIQQLQLKAYSKRSIENYTMQISHLALFYNCSPDLLSTEQIRSYIQQKLNKDHVSKSWLNQFISAWKILYCEVLKREWNAIDIPRPRREKKLPVILSREELSLLIKLTINLKHRTIFMLAYSAGLRVGEVVNLKLTDVDSDRMLLRIRLAKGFKDRYCNLSPVILEQLREFWKRYRPQVWLFETKPKHQISERTLQTLFRQAVKRAKITKPVTFHSLRHSFATHLMEQGVNLPLIQQLLGHKSLRTTSIYLHVQQYSVDAVKSPLDILSL